MYDSHFVAEDAKLREKSILSPDRDEKFLRGFTMLTKQNDAPIRGLDRNQDGGKLYRGSGDQAGVSHRLCSNRLYHINVVLRHELSLENYK